jgi:aldose 1-epimerase
MVNIKSDLFGTTPEGEKVGRFIIENSSGITANIITLGSNLISLKMPDRKGDIKEITLGFDNLSQYLTNNYYFGATVGRFANRIAGGIFQLDGARYHLACNEKGLNHLHGGNKGFDKVIWQAEAIEEFNLAGVRLSYLSPDGEERYPGNLEVEVHYSLNEDNELKIEYFARTDKPTIINLTNHTYWNLAGAGSGTVMNHQLTIKSDEYLPVDNNLIPTGEIKSVHGTPLDFTKTKLIGRDFMELQGGYDHCFVLKSLNHQLKLAAILHEPESGRTMKISTTKPGIQFYSGNMLEDIRGAEGVLFNKYGGLCLETEYFPNAINEPGFISPILYPENVYHHITTYHFSIQ